ncbi:hypothetical protein Rs2_38107 [Raphanus sativus]|nr:hypothetical protein Rs2_38107 [Raphanus sativus]
MPSGAKKRKAAKKKQQQEASSTLKSINHGSTEEEAVRIVKETGLDTNEQRVEITDSSHDHDKSSSSNSSSSGSGSGSSSSDDDESHEVKEETEVIITVPSQPVPVAGDAPFIGSTANAIVENAGLMDSTTPSDPETENIVVTSSAAEASLASDESKQASSSTTGSDKKELKKCVPEGSKESQVVISHVEEDPVRPTHGDPVDKLRNLSRRL